MTILKKELKQGRKALCIWTAATALMILICIFMYPEIKAQMSGINQLFGNMGGFTAAFGMDQINFGEMIGFYGLEAGNILGIGGGFFAAFLGISILAKEEKDHTAEFLLTHPISRTAVFAQKLSAVFIQIILFNLVIMVCSMLSITLIGEAIAWKVFFLLHLAFFLLQIELASICFGISAFLRHGGIGIGLGLTALFYFLNIIQNISSKVEFLKYLSPFAYAEAAVLITKMRIDPVLITIGLLVCLTSIFLGFIHYQKKDIS